MLGSVGFMFLRQSMEVWKHLYTYLRDSEPRHEILLHSLVVSTLQTTSEIQLVWTRTNFLRGKLHLPINMNVHVVPLWVALHMEAQSPEVHERARCEGI